MIVDFAQEKLELGRLLGIQFDDRQSASVSMIMLAMFDKGMAFERRRIKEIVKARDGNLIDRRELISTIERPV